MRLEFAVAGIIVLFVGIIVIVSSTGVHEWAGADGQSESAIAKLSDGSYQPWFHSVWEPPSGEIESLLFALQASLGSIIIGYFLGYYRALAKMKAQVTSEEQEGKSNAQPSR